MQTENAGRPGRKKLLRGHKYGERKKRLLELIGRPLGATTAELARALKWQKVTVRAYICNLGDPEIHVITRPDGARAYTLNGVGS